MVAQEVPDDGALGAGAAAVDQAHLAESARRRLLQIFRHDGRDIARGEGVQIEAVLDGNDDRLGLGVFHLLASAQGRPAPTWMTAAPSKTRAPPASRCGAGRSPNTRKATS